MPETKTIECFSKFCVFSKNEGSKGVIETSIPKIKESSEILVCLETKFEEDTKGLPSCLYKGCKEGELVIGYKGEEMFSFNLEQGELIVVCPENYDFELKDGYLIVSCRTE